MNMPAVNFSPRERAECQKQLEQILDTLGLAYLLDDLAIIALEEAVRIEQSEDDVDRYQSTAATWRKHARLLQEVWEQGGGK